jgi:hypothetical protein
MTTTWPAAKPRPTSRRDRLPHGSADDALSIFLDVRPRLFGIGRCGHPARAPPDPAVGIVVAPELLNLF